MSCVVCAEEGHDGCAEEYAEALAQSLAAAQSRIAELERMVVWLSRRQRLWDGTPASILAAVEKAMGGGE